MPLYEYACTECGSHLEVRQRMTEDPLTTCPRCETDALERLVSMSSFALKGGGWYADGYGNAKADANKADAGSTISASDGTKPEKKTADAKSTDKAPSPPKTESKSPSSNAA